MPQRNAKHYDIYLNGVLTENLFEVLNMSESAGIDRLDYAELQDFRLPLEGRELSSSGVTEEIEIVDPDTLEVVHWGKIGLVPTSLNQNGEDTNVVSRTERFHLGKQVNGYWIWHPLKPPVDEDGETGAPEFVSLDLVFNPIIDGKICGNLNSIRTSAQNDDEEEIGHPLFLDPESVRTQASVALQSRGLTTSVAAINWPLSKAIHYLLQTHNAGETYISNPTLAEIEGACNDASDLVVNTVIQRGQYLAEALDVLLQPLGYRWKVQRTGFRARKYAFFSRNSGALVAVRHQLNGSQLDIDATNVAGFAVTFDATKCANEVTVVGGYFGFEVSVELHRGWPAAQDGLDEAKYAKTAENFASVKDAWRKWVLNEAGDYIGLRDEIDGLFTTAFRESMTANYTDEVLNEFGPRRRRFAPTLTLGTDKAPIGPHNGIEVECWNPHYDADHPEFGKEWLPIGNWGMRTLEHECGIYFDAEFPPLEEQFGTNSRSDIRLRVTATIYSDKRLEDTAARHVDSPHSDVVPLLIDAPTKFRYQEVSPLSKYFESGRPSLEQKDVLEIAAFSERLRSIWDLMDIGGAIQLEGLDRDYFGLKFEVGQRVHKVAGKEISFRAKSGVDEYPQIVAIDRNVTNQTMTLHLQRFAQSVNFSDGKRAKARARRG